MASAVIVSRNEPNWPQVASSFMGKNPNHNHNLISPNFNTNPNPNSTNHPGFFRGGSRKPNHQNHHQNGDEFVNPTVSDDAASSICRRPARLVGESETGLAHYVSYHVSSCSRSDLRELKARLVVELEQIRVLSGRIESGELMPQPRGGVPKGSVKEKKASGTKRAAPFSPMRKEAKQRTASSSPPQAPVVTNNFSPVVEEAVSVHPALAGSEEEMKMCKQSLNKLMRNKFCFWFNKPVDVEGMRLFDYYDIIKNPMDLGTVRSKLGRDAYSNPDEFAADVRLTFNNAMLYNPEGQEVHKYAKDLLLKFEGMFLPIAQRFDTEKQQSRMQVLQQQQMRQANRTPVQRHATPPQVMPVTQSQIKQLQRRPMEQEMYHEKKQFDVEKMDNEELVEVVDDELQGSSWSKIASPGRPPSKKGAASSKQQQERQVEPSSEPLAPPVSDVSKQAIRPAPPKLPKPKAKEPNKREMTILEKHRLGMGLQSLPEEKMAHVVQIIRKRNGHLTQDGDEIELDIEAVDTETLWELDRFVTNYKKAASKLKRQVMMPINNVAHIESNMGAGASERVSRKGGGGDIGEEDVDIGDEIPMSHFPPVEIEKDDDGQAAASGSSCRSSSSSSGSSSSSDSDSGSSSDSDSDVDDALSRDNGSKSFHNT